MTCRLFDAKPLSPYPMLTYCQLNHWSNQNTTISLVKMQLKMSPAKWRLCTSTFQALLWHNYFDRHRFYSSIRFDIVFLLDGVNNLAELMAP